MNTPDYERKYRELLAAARDFFRTAHVVDNPDFDFSVKTKSTAYDDGSMESSNNALFLYRLVMSATEE